MNRTMKQSLRGELWQHVATSKNLSTNFGDEGLLMFFFDQSQLHMSGGVVFYGLVNSKAASLTPLS